MGKNKLAKFAELETFERVIQPNLDEVLKKDFVLKGKWNKDFFKNNNPIVLELGCGKGEYSIGLSQKFTNKNFIGIDIKGARIWKGAKYAHLNKLPNVGFIRTRIELIKAFFNPDEVNEIWVTFPDPQLKKRRNKKRLTGSIFLNQYRHFLIHNGIMHLKTDNDVLYNYTLELVRYNKLEILCSTNDLYNSGLADDILSIKTHYEQLYLKDGKNINYLKFRLNKNQEILELPDEEEIK